MNDLSPGERYLKRLKLALYFVAITALFFSLWRAFSIVKGFDSQMLSLLAEQALAFVTLSAFIYFFVRKQLKK